MEKVIVKVPAKVNLTLDVTGEKGGFHTIKSLVASISLYDVITLSKREDKKVTLACSGIDALCPTEENNAYKTACAVVKEFGLNGVDILLEKSIPVGAGLGGSSADIAGVLKGMQQLYQIEGDLTGLANSLGSDVAFMLKGGWAVIEGKGEKITPVKPRRKLFLLILTADQSVGAGECYKKFDEQAKIYPPATDKAVRILLDGDEWGFLESLKNDLYNSAREILPQIEKNLGVLLLHGDAFMTGSGSATVGVYTSLYERNKVYKELHPVFGKKLIKAMTL